MSLVEGQTLCSKCGTDYAKEFVSAEGFAYMEKLPGIKLAE